MPSDGENSKLQEAGSIQVACRSGFDRLKRNLRWTPFCSIFAEGVTSSAKREPANRLFCSVFSLQIACHKENETWMLKFPEV